MARPLTAATCHYATNSDPPERTFLGTFVLLARARIFAWHSRSLTLAACTRPDLAIKGTFQKEPGKGPSVASISMGPLSHGRRGHPGLISGTARPCASWLGLIRSVN